jgi:hypothetical protein
MKEPTYEGLYFHSYVDGLIQWQGFVERQLPGKRYIVKTFDWGPHAPVQKTVTDDEMATWSFYTTNEEMLEAFTDFVREGGARVDRTNESLKEQLLRNTNATYPNKKEIK